jgi:hypothetical protein
MELQSTKKVLQEELDDVHRRPLTTQKILLERENTLQQMNEKVAVTDKLQSNKADLLAELDVMKKKLKTSQKKVKHYKSQTNHHDVELMDQYAIIKFCKVIKKAVAVALPGRHLATKAKWWQMIYLQACFLVGKGYVC